MLGCTDGCVVVVGRTLGINDGCTEGMGEGWAVGWDDGDDVSAEIEYLKVATP